MSQEFVLALITHVIMGVVAVGATFLVLMALLKTTPNLKKLRITSLIAALGYYFSWFSGGYYYWFYYGKVVKPIILEGEYVWAHKVVMEAKEHVFLLLPVMSLVTLAFVYLSGARLMTDPGYKKAVTYFVSVSFVLAVLITLSGVLISGGAR